MSAAQDKFDAAIWTVVQAIPRGQVMAYGEVARAAGFPRHARMVSKAMGRSPAALPWHRVVRADRSLAFEVGSEGFEAQRERLELEGVTMFNGKVIAEQPTEDLDALIWGPD
jgi:methylated-DNA-protein-cysteine methyltransferase related protein